MFVVRDDCWDFVPSTVRITRKLGESFSTNERFGSKCSGKLQECSQNTSEIISEICGVERMGYRKRVEG